jgi:hydroxymethylpyrimidine pyrophosphatase-like HAD family hydrolase
VYKANITVYGKSLSGLFIAKKINDSTHRVVFTTEFGNSLMDLEIGPESFKVNSIVEDLDKKIILKTLKNDFRLILANKHFIRNEYENGQEKVYQSKDGSRFNFLFADKKAEQLHKIVRASRFKEKVIVSFTSTNGQLAETIYVKHKNIKLGIALNYLKN